MTLATSTSKVSYSGNGINTVFAVPFYFMGATHIQVILRNSSGVETVQTLTTDYLVTVVAPTGGSVTMNVAPATGQTLVILRNVPLTQEVDYIANDSFPASTHEMALDKLTMEVQQLNEVLSRAVVAQASDTYTPSTLLQQIIAYNASSAASASSALASWQSFEGIYYGTYASAPSTDPLGQPIAVGDMYYNSSLQSLQIYTSTGWQATAQATPVSYTSQTFNGTGVQTAFTLSTAPASIIATEVFISGVRQRPTTDYTVSGTTLTFIAAPATGTNNIFVRWTYAIAVGVPNDASVTTAKFAGSAKAPLCGVADTATALSTTANSKIFPVTAATASNQLTVTLNPCYIDFRSPTLTSGTINTRQVASTISLVVPQFTSMGANPSGGSTRIAILAIDNSGTVELALSNLSGGLNLDESGVITTTAISSGTFATLIYSATARTSVPYRVVGFVDVVYNTVLGWSYAVSLVQGLGGQPLASLSSLGFGQTWQDVTVSRALATTFYNTTGRPIAVAFTSSAGSAPSATAVVNGVTIQAFAASGLTGSLRATLSFIVPQGASYSISGSTISNWSELR